MGIFTSDNFNAGTPGDNLTVDTAWEANAGTAVYSDAGRARISGTTSTLYSRKDVAPASADYKARATIRALTLITNASAGVAVRCQTGANTAYIGRGQHTSNTWRLERRIAGASTLLGSSSQTFSTATDYVVELDVSGTTLELFADGVSVVGPVTDSNITTAGAPGLNWFQGSPGSNTAGWHTENFEGEEAGSGSITGDLAATESGSDTASFVGDVIVSGSLAATESGADTAAFTGFTEGAIVGNLAATESGSDTAAFAGVVIVSGTLAATETGSDTAAFTGTVPLSTITGTLDATESGSDSASFIGAGVVTRTQHVVRYIYRPYSNATERKYIEQLNEDLRTLYGQIAALSRGSVSGHDARESAPAGGTWQQGDFVRKFSPTEQGTSGSKYIVTGWSCVASGSPGTWVECRVLTGN